MFEATEVFQELYLQLQQQNKHLTNRSRTFISQVFLLLLFSIVMAQKWEVISSKEAIQNLMKYSQSHHQLLQMFNLSFLISYFDRYTIQQLQERMGRTRRLYCSSCGRWPVSSSTFLFLVMTLVELFGKVARQVGSEGSIKVKHFTGYICEGISGQQREGVVCSKEISQEGRGRTRGGCEKSTCTPQWWWSVASGSALRYRVSKISTSTKISRSTKILRSIKKKKVDSSKPLRLLEMNRTRLALGQLGSHISISSLQMRKVNDIKPACLSLRSTRSSSGWAVQQRTLVWRFGTMRTILRGAACRLGLRPDG